MRTTFVASLLLVPILCGCVVIPQGTLVGGGPTPNTRMKDALSDGRVKVGVSKAEAVAAVLMEYYGASPRYGPALYESKPLGELAVEYREACSAYGLTLNQHFYFVPMPMFGAGGEERRTAVLLKYDQEGVLREWRCVSDPDLAQYEYRPHKPKPPTPPRTRTAGAATRPMLRHPVGATYAEH